MLVHGVVWQGAQGQKGWYLCDMIRLPFQAKGDLSHFSVSLLFPVVAVASRVTRRFLAHIYSRHVQNQEAASTQSLTLTGFSRIKCCTLCKWMHFDFHFFIFFGISSISLIPAIPRLRWQTSRPTRTGRSMTASAWHCCSRAAEAEAASLTLRKAETSGLPFRTLGSAQLGDATCLVVCVLYV